MTPTAADAAAYLEAHDRHDLASAVYLVLGENAHYRGGARTHPPAEVQPVTMDAQPIARQRRTSPPPFSSRVLYLAFQLGEAFPGSIPTRAAAKARMGWTSNSTASKAIRALREMRGQS